MAITRHSNFDKTVQTIIDRNNISNKVNGMMVVVLDAIADPNAGSGKAIYRWESSDSSWILVSKSTTETMNFVTEELAIVNGEAQLSYIPVDNQVWNGVILNGSLIYADLNIKNITIANGKISGFTSDVNGLILRVTYAYGTISQQITTAIEDSVDSALLNNLKTINGNDIVGTGNIEVTAALPEFKTINSESIVGTGDIQIVTDISGKADKATTIAGYGITDAYTKSEVESKIVELSPPTDISMKADITYVDNKITDIINLAPSTLDTLGEIATQLTADEGAVATLTSIVNNKVDKVAGKQLSTEDFTTAEKTKLAGLSNYTKPSSEPISYITNLQTNLDSKADKSTTYTKTEVNAKIVELAPTTDISGKADKATTLAGYNIADAYTKTEVDSSLGNKADKSTTFTKAEVTAEIQKVVGAAPVALDTLKEIADQLANDESAVSALTNVVSGKVDKVAGKGLSTEDYTTTEKSKLASLSNYTLPVASSTVLGGVKAGANISIDQNGVISSSAPSDINLSSVTGDILPSLNQTYNIGSPTNRWKGIYVDEAYLAIHTLYLGDTPVLGTNQDTIVIKADLDQSLLVKTSGTGSTQIQSATSVDIVTSGTNADVKIQATGTNSKVRLSGTGGIELSNPTTAQSDFTVSGNLTVSGNVIANGNQFLVNATTVTTKDNIVVINYGEVGSGVTSGKAGIQIDRGDAADFQLVFDESTKKFVMGQVGGTFETISSREYVDAAKATLDNSLALKVDKVAGKDLSSNDYTTAEKSKLSNIEAGAQVNTVASVAGKTGAVTLTSGDVGLSNVDNTSDVNKPVSTATQTALNNKVDKVTGKGLSTEDYTTAEKTKLSSIEVNANNYTLPVASATVLGGVKAGTNISIDADGVISANDSSVAWSEITSKPTTISGYGITDAYTKTETDSAISTSINNLVNGAPAALDTLKEIATQLANDESVVNSLIVTVGTKANSSDVYTKAEIDAKIPNISSTEFNTGMKRGTKIVYGIEVDAGLLTNATTKDVSFTFNSSYTYWLDAQNSYASSASEVLPLPYSAVGIGESIGVKLDLTNNKIKITSGIDRTSLSGKIVILYTK